MDKIIKYTLLIIASLGGVSGIVVTLSKYLGKIWASKILEEQKKDHEIEISEYKYQLEVTINKMNSINEKVLHISKTQYDKEFQIYQEIWEELHNCIVYTKNLYPIFEDIPSDENKKEEYFKEKYSYFREHYNSFSLVIDKYAPFYNYNFYENFDKIRSTCSEIGLIFKMYKFDMKYNESFANGADISMTREDRKKVYIEFHKDIENLKKKTLNDIRDYLQRLQVIDYR